MRRFLLVIAWILLALSLGGLAFALVASPRWGIGLFAAVLLVVVVGGLGQLATRQRETIHDIKRDLARSRVAADTLVDASPDGIVLLDGLTIASTNAAARRLFGIRSDEDVSGRLVEDLVTSHDRGRVAAWIEARESGAVEPDSLEFEGRRASGVRIPLEATAARIPAGGNPHLALFLRDLTDRRRLMERSSTADRLEALGAGAASLADEFEGVFEGVRGGLSAARGAGSPELLDHALDVIDRETSRGVSLALRARALAPQSVDPADCDTIDVRQTLDAVSREVAAQFGGRVRFEDVSPASEKPLTAFAVPSAFRQALRQILENATEAQGDGVLRTRTYSLDPILSDSNRTQGTGVAKLAVIGVKDEGPGMSEETRRHAFAPFFSTKGAESSGLGLTLAAGVVRAHGGFIELHSEPGKGTVARLAFPAADEATMAALREASPGTAVGAEGTGTDALRGRETLLAIDDDVGALETYRRLLQPLGYHVEVAAAAEVALQRLRQRPEVDLVLLDQVMPSWTGPELTRRILKSRPGQRVLAVSPYPLPDKEQQALAYGAVGIEHKPLESERLARAVRRALDGPPPP